MRILHISKYCYPARGGIESFVRDLAVEQVRQGHEVTVLCHQPQRGSVARQQDREGVRYVQAKTLFRLAFSPVSVAFPRLLKRVVRTFRPDIIHLHLPNPAVLFVHLLPLHFPLVVHWHADVDGASGLALRLLYPLYRFFEQRVLDRAQQIVATSPPYAASSRSLMMFKSKCCVVPLGLDIARYPEAGGSKPSEKPLVLSVGRFAYYKGFDVLIRAARHFPSARFVLVGAGPKYDAIQDQVKQLGLDENVELPGVLSDEAVQDLLQMASVVCVPSLDRAEAFGMVQLEAMRYGVPLISSAIPGSGVGWVNQDGVTGLTVPPGDEKALVTALEWMLTNEQERVRMGQAGSCRLEDMFRIERVAQELETVYAQLLCHKSAAVE